MPTALLNPKFYMFDPDTGKPLDGGKVYTYKSGTSTPKATYTDESGDTTNPNPVTLNAAGYAPIYLDGVYKIVIKKSDDSDVWDEDPVSSMMKTVDLDFYVASVADLREVTGQVADYQPVLVVEQENLSNLSVWYKYDPDETGGDDGEDIIVDANNRRWVKTEFTGKVVGGIVQYENDGSDNAVIRPPYNDKAIGGLAQYENNGSDEPIINFPNQAAQRYASRATTKTVSEVTTLTVDDHGKIILVNYSTSGFDITLPAHADGLRFFFVVIDDSNSGDIKDGSANTLKTLVKNEQTAAFVSNGSSWKDITGLEYNNPQQSAFFATIDTADAQTITDAVGSATLLFEIASHIDTFDNRGEFNDASNAWYADEDGYYWFHAAVPVKCTTAEAQVQLLINGVANVPRSYVYLDHGNVTTIQVSGFRPVTKNTWVFINVNVQNGDIETVLSAPNSASFLGYRVF